MGVQPRFRQSLWEQNRGAGSFQALPPDSEQQGDQLWNEAFSLLQGGDRNVSWRDAAFLSLPENGEASPGTRLLQSLQRPRLHHRKNAKAQRAIPELSE